MIEGQSYPRSERCDIIHVYALLPVRACSSAKCMLLVRGDLTAMLYALITSLPVTDVYSNSQTHQEFLWARSVWTWIVPVARG